MAGPATPTTDDDTGYRLRQDVEYSGTLPNHVDAGHAATTVLCTLAARLSRGEVAKLAAALPDPLATILRYCPRPAGDAGESFDGEGFKQRVADHLQVTPELA